MQRLHLLLLFFVGMMLVATLTARFWLTPLVPGDLPTAPPGLRVDLNTSDSQTLCLLPGVGSGLAQRIIDYRVAHGGFKSIDELRNISGIGERTFNRLAPFVTLPASTPIPLSPMTGHEAPGRAGVGARGGE